MDGADPHRWSAVAESWADLWGGFAEPAWDVVVEAAAISSGSRHPG